MSLSRVPNNYEYVNNIPDLEKLEYNDYDEIFNFHEEEDSQLAVIMSPQTKQLKDKFIQRDNTERSTTWKEEKKRQLF